VIDYDTQNVEVERREQELTFEQFIENESYQIPGSTGVVNE